MSNGQASELHGVRAPGQRFLKRARAFDRVELVRLAGDYQQIRVAVLILVLVPITGYAAAEEAGYTPHIRRIGEEKLDASGEKTYPARRWVVERTLAWLSRCRGILIRWDKKAECYLANIKLACALLWFRRMHKLHDQKVLK